MSEIEDLLAGAAEEVLETMFYSAVCGPGTESAEGPYWSAGVTFRGSCDGSLAVSAPQSTAMALAAAFLGESVDEVPAAQVPAVIGELANVLCGVVLGRLEEGGQFAIAPPRASLVDSPARVLPHPAVRCIFELEEGTLAVGLTIEPVSTNE